MTRNVNYAITYERNKQTRTIYLNCGNEGLQLMRELSNSFAISKTILMTSELDGQVLARMIDGKLDYIATDLIVTQ